MKRLTDEQLLAYRRLSGVENWHDSAVMLPLLIDELVTLRLEKSRPVCLQCGGVAGDRGVVDGWHTSWCSSECSDAWFGKNGTAQPPEGVTDCKNCEYWHQCSEAQCRELYRLTGKRK